MAIYVVSVPILSILNDLFARELADYCSRCYKFQLQFEQNLINPNILLLLVGETKMPTNQNKEVKSQSYLFDEANHTKA